MRARVPILLAREIGIGSIWCIWDIIMDGDDTAHPQGVVGTGGAEGGR